MTFSSYTSRTVLGRVAICLLGQLVVFGQMQLLVRNSGSGPSEAVGALIVADRYVITGRSPLLAAVSVESSTGKPESVAGDDPDADLVLLRVPQARDSGRIQQEPLEPGMTLGGMGFQATVDKAVDVPGFGTVFRLRHEKAHPARGSPLWNDKGEMAAWFVAKTVDGQALSFAIPVERLLCLAPATQARSLPDWMKARPADHDRRLTHALGYLWAQDYDGASFYFRELTARHPQSAHAWFYLAFSEGKMGRAKQKIAAYRKALQLEPQWGAASFNLGLALLLEGDPGGAQEECSRLTEFDPVQGARLQAFIENLHVDPFPKRPAAQ